MVHLHFIRVSDIVSLMFFPKQLRHRIWLFLQAISDVYNPPGSVDAFSDPLSIAHNTESILKAKQGVPVSVQRMVGLQHLCMLS